MNKIQVSKLKDYEYNNKIHNEDQITEIIKSIKEFGFNSPIIIDKDNVIIAGHGRAESARRMGLKEVPVIVKDNLTELQVKKYRLLDNKIAELSKDNIGNIKYELEEIENLQGGEVDIFDFKELYFDYDNIEEIKEPYTGKGMDFPQQQQYRDREEQSQISGKELGIYESQQDNVEGVDDILGELNNVPLPETNKSVVRGLQIPVKQENYEELWEEFKTALNNGTDVGLLLLKSLKDENNRNS